MSYCDPFQSLGKEHIKRFWTWLSGSRISVKRLAKLLYLVLMEIFLAVKTKQTKAR